MAQTRHRVFLFGPGNVKEYGEKLAHASTLFPPLCLFVAINAVTAGSVATTNNLRGCRSDILNHIYQYDKTEQFIYGK